MTYAQNVMENDMTENFYNTIGETGTELKASRRAVNKQEKEVLEKFKEFGDEPSPISPSEIHEILPGYPITSIRRAITNLTDAGYLRKTYVKIVGPWGKREHCWELVNDPTN